MIHAPLVCSLAIASAGGVDPLVRDIGFSLVISGLLCVVFARLRIPSIAAFLAAGLVIGPQIGGVVTDRGNIETIANLGLTLLLFMIGLEIDFKKLRASGKTLVIVGALQFPLCVAFGWAAMTAVQATGWEAVAGTYVPVYFGFAVAASSTLLVVKMLQEKFQLDTVAGRISLGLLIFQDLWAIVVLAVQPNFKEPDLAPVAYTLLGIALLTVFAVFLAKYVLPTAFHWIAKSPELILVAALGWCFSIGALGNNLGNLLDLVGLHLPIHVSMEMGALIAGASIASLRYSHEVVSKVGVVRDFFITLFFVGLGMGIPAPDSLSVVFLTLVLAALAVAARLIVFFPLMYFTGLDRRNSFVSSVKLAQISEFCLVIAYIGAGFDHVDSGFVSSIIFAFVATALLTPLLFKVADPLHDKLGGLLSKLGFRVPPVATDSKVEEGPGALVLLGFHRVASSLLREISDKRPALLRDVLVVDFNVALHPAIEAAGARVRYADLSNSEALHHLGLDKAKVVVSTIPDDILKGTSNLKLTKVLREMNPSAVLIATALGTDSAAQMRAAGADWVMLPRLETASSLLPVLDSAFSGNADELGIAMDDLLADAARRPEVLC